jgi:hypothetical protein
MTTTTAAFHFVAPVTHTGGDLVADLDEGKTSVRINDAVDRISGGMRPASMYAVWEFEERPNPVQAADRARDERPAHILVHVGDGELLEIADSYRLQLVIKED